MKNIGKLAIWILLINLVMLNNACVSDDFFEDSLGETTIQSDDMDYKVLLNSHEFRHLNEKYTDFVFVIQNSVKNLSQDEIDKFTELFLLYKGNPVRYESLYKHYVCNVLLKDKYDEVERIYTSFLEARKVMLDNGEFVECIKKNENFVTSHLMKNAGQIIPIASSTGMVKTRTENNVQKCLDLCWEKYDADMDHAYLVLTCGTALNIGACLLSLGVSIPGSAWTQAGLLAYYEIEANTAKRNYEICKKECYL